MTPKQTMVAILVMATFVLTPLHLSGQNPGQPPAAPAPARTQAPVDLTGYWVSFITEDWRYRMITPPKGDYAGVPLTPEGRMLADAWNPAADEAAGNSCKSYGAPAIMRAPTRLHVTWQDDNTLRIDADAGMQTRLFRFGAAGSTPSKQSLQGDSTAQWERPSSLKVLTRNMQSGYLRRNGVPYSENAALTEYFDLSPLPN